MSSLKSNTISGFKWTGIFLAANVLLNLAVLVALGYFLDQEQLGMKAIIALVIGLASTITQFGIAQAVIQKKEVKNSELNGIFIVNFLIGLVMFIILFFLSSPIASFYNNAELTSLLKISSFMFLLEPLGVVFLALLEKELMFRTATLMNLIKLIANSGLTIVLAYLGYGPLSFAAGQIFGVVLFTVILSAYFFKRKMWIPTLKFSFSEVKPFYEFGLYVTAKNFTNYFSKNFDEMIVGKLLGLEMLGIYHFAKQAVDKFITVATTAVSKVTYPLYCKVAQETNGAEKFKTYYLKMTKLVTFAGFPALTAMVLLIPLAVDLFFQGQWNAAIVVMQIFTMKGMIDILSAGFASNALYAYNRPKTVFKVDAYYIPVRLAMLFIACMFSIEWVAVSYLLFVLIKSFTLQQLVNKEVGMTFGAYLSQFKWSFTINLILGAALYWITMIYSGPVTLAFLLLTYLLLYAASMFLLDRGTFKTLQGNVKGMTKIG